MLLVVIAALLTLPAGARGQEVRRYTGVAAGVTSSRQIWKPEVAVADRMGAFASVFSDMPFPLGPFRVRVEAAYAQRGGLVESDFDGAPLQGETRGDWLSVFLAAKLAGSAGPAHLFVTAGPVYELRLRTRLDAVLAQLLNEERPRSFGVVASAGAGVTVGGAWVGEIEARWVEGLTTVLEGDFVRTRSRSVELLLRLGKVRPPS